MTDFHFYAENYKAELKQTINRWSTFGQTVYGINQDTSKAYPVLYTYTGKTETIATGNAPYPSTKNQYWILEEQKDLLASYDEPVPILYDETKPWFRRLHEALAYCEELNK